MLGAVVVRCCEMAAMRAYIDATSRVLRGDQRRSAMAAVRGQMRLSTFSGVTYSDHMVASPPRMRLLWSLVSVVRPSPSGSAA